MNQTQDHLCGIVNGNSDNQVIRYCLKQQWGREWWHELPCRGDHRLCNCPYPNKYQVKEGRPPQSRQFPLF